MICNRCKHDSVMDDKCVLCGWPTTKGKFRSACKFLSWLINTCLGIIALGLILRGIQKLFLLGWRIL